MVPTLLQRSALHDPVSSETKWFLDALTSAQSVTAWWEENDERVPVIKPSSVRRASLTIVSDTSPRIVGPDPDLE